MKKSISFFAFVLVLIASIFVSSCDEPLNSVNNQKEINRNAYKNNKIAFTSYESRSNSRTDVFLMELDGSNLQNVTAKIGNSQQPSYSPDGSSIVFLCNTEVYIMDADGGNARQITNKPGVPYKSFPVFSKDGQTILFYSKTGDYTSKLDIYEVNVDGSNYRNLTNQHASCLSPDFSPDKSKIVYWAVFEKMNGDIFSDIYKMDADGNNKVSLTPSSGNNIYPKYSPDGSKIVFCAQRKGDQQYSLYIMNSDGSQQRKIYGSDRMVSFPQFTSSGSKIVFTLENDNQSITNICTINPDGSGFRNLTNSANRNWGPVLTSDGLQIVFESDRDGNDEIYIMNFDGSDPTRLTTNTKTDFQPTLRYH